MGLDTKTYWLTDRQSQCNFDFDFTRVVKSEPLSANIKRTLHKALIRPVTTYPCPVWELGADTYLLKLQRIQNKVRRTMGDFPRSPSVRDLYAAFNLPYVYDYITKLCRQQAKVIQNHENEHARGIGQGEA
jgi:hypothetical protein